jgi:hypothetical protein
MDSQAAAPLGTWTRRAVGAALLLTTISVGGTAQASAGRVPHVSSVSARYQEPSRDGLGLAADGVNPKPDLGCFGFDTCNELIALCIGAEHEYHGDSDQGWCDTNDNGKQEPHSG